MDKCAPDRRGHIGRSRYAAEVRCAQVGGLEYGLDGAYDRGADIRVVEHHRRRPDLRDGIILPVLAYPSQLHGYSTQCTVNPNAPAVTSTISIAAGITSRPMPSPGMTATL